MCMIIVINEFGDCVVVTPSYHARWSFFRCNYVLSVSSSISTTDGGHFTFLHIVWFLCCAWREASNHLLIFRHSYALPLDHLKVFQSAQNLMLNSKGSLHLICAAFLDRKWRLAQILQSAWTSQIDCDVRTSFNFESERIDDAFSRVIGVCDNITTTESE